MSRARLVRLGRHPSTWAVALVAAVVLLGLAVPMVTRTLQGREAARQFVVSIQETCEELYAETHGIPPDVGGVIAEIPASSITDDSGIPAPDGPSYVAYEYTVAWKDFRCVAYGRPGEGFSYKVLDQG